MSLRDFINRIQQYCRCIFIVQCCLTVHDNDAHIIDSEQSSEYQTQTEEREQLLIASSSETAPLLVPLIKSETI
jgi:hypothetical protein